VWPSLPPPPRYTLTVTPDGISPALLDREAIEYLDVLGERVEYRQGDTIIRRGETGHDFWVVLDGEVEVLMSDGESTESLVHLGAGDSFGELAILRDAPASADVVATSRATLLRYPGEYLPTALSECAPLRRSLLTRMAHDVYRQTSQAFSLSKQARAMADLFQKRLPEGAMIGESARMRAVNTAIDRAASAREPVLISGEFGTGKLLAARVIHSRSDRRDAPLIALDCRELSDRDANRLLFGTGTASNADLSAERYGALHLAHRGTLVLRGIESLSLDAQRELGQRFAAEAEVEATPFPDVRIIATIDTNTCGQDHECLDDGLRNHLASIISVPTLSERPRDIIPLAQTFLDEIDTTGKLSFSSSAEQALVSLKYRHRNVAELRSVVELAARVADEDEIRAEHIFSGFDGERPIGYEITDFWLVRWLVTKGGLPLVRFVVAVIFLAMTAICLAAAGSAVAAITNNVVWMLWEPVVFALFLFVGTVWCTICPLSSTGRAVQRWFSLDRPPPAWILRAGSWLSAATFVLILWSEEFYHMAANPFPTGMLLLGLVLSAVICCLLWQREVWCRHICPLGRLGSALAPVAPLQIAARRSVCASTCTTHDCYKGNDRVAGCSVWHHPQLVSEGHRCKTCLACLQSCPHGSAGLYLRPRLRSAWRLINAESYMVPFALTIFFLSPVLVLLQRGSIPPEPLWISVSCWATLAMAAVAAPILSPAIQESGRTTALSAATACALLVLGWGPLMAYQMKHIALLDSLVVLAEPGTWWAVWPGPAVTVMSIVRVAWVVFAAVLSATILWNANGQARKSGVDIRVSGWTALIVICTAYTFWMLWMVV